MSRNVNEILCLDISGKVLDETEHAVRVEITTWLPKSHTQIRYIDGVKTNQGRRGQLFSLIELPAWLAQQRNLLTFCETRRQEQMRQRAIERRRQQYESGRERTA